MSSIFSVRPILFLFAIVTTPVFTVILSAQEATPSNEARDEAVVGRNEDGTSVTPVNQLLTPYGQQLDLSGLPPQALALSHNARMLAVSGKSNKLLIVDPDSGTIAQQVEMPAESAREADAAAEVATDRSAQVSYTGIIFSSDDQRI